MGQFSTIINNRPSRKFKPKIGKGSPEEYLSLLRTFAESEKAAVMPALGSMVPADAVPQPRGRIEASVLNAITRAISSRTGLEIRYQSLNSAEPGTKYIWPHALVFSGTRWHARVFDETRSAFIDLVLQRILSAKLFTSTTSSSADADKDWRNFVTLEVRPNSTFTSSQADVIAKEFGMNQNGRQWIWEVRLRNCLAGYFIYHYRLDLPDDPQRLIELCEKGVIERYRLIAPRGKTLSSAKAKG